MRGLRLVNRNAGRTLGRRRTAAAAQETLMSTGPSHDSPPQVLPFSVECFRRPAGPLIATLCGDVDIANAGLLVDAVIAETETAPAPGVVLDFAGVPFMDSSGLRAVLEISRRLEEDAAGLVLLNPVSAVRQLLTLAGVDERIPVAAGLEQAEALLAAPGRPA